MKKYKMPKETYDYLSKTTEEIKRMSENKIDSLDEFKEECKLYKDIKCKRLRNHVYSLRKDLLNLHARVWKIESYLKYRTIIEE